MLPFPSWLSTLRLRAAWGQAGNAPGPFAATRAYTMETAKAWVNGEPFVGEEGLVRVCMPKYVATNNAIRIVDLAMEIVGSIGIFKKHPLERYYRDVRAGTNHPFSNARMRELIGKNALGINLLEMPRW